MLTLSLCHKMDEREKELKDKRICRFCMTQEEPLTNIHSAECRVNTKVSLPVQILACTSIEVFSNDTMPTTICSSCRLLMDYCYRFKQNCKTSDTKLKQYPLTGVWPDALETLKIPNEMLWLPKDDKPNRSPIKSTSPQQSSKLTPPIKQTVKREIIRGADQPISKNVHNIINMEPKILRVKDDSGETVYEISETGEPQVKRPKLSDLVKGKSKVPNNNYPLPESAKRVVKQEEPVTKQLKKLLNNTPKILNNSVAKMKKHQQYLSEPIIKTDEMGNVEIFTELIEKNDDDGQSDDPMKFAPPVETNVFPCNQCERTFPLKQLLELHMANHNRERSFQCGICSKSFYSKYDLGKHVSIHTGEKPYQCVVCKKCFSRSTLLFRHEKVHTDQPKFLCDHCDRAFLSLDELNKHAETHRKFRPFQCDVCSKSFAFKQGLERHKVIHGTDQPFPCEYCDKSFMTRGKLARHLTAHAGERPYPCKLCPKSFLLSHHLTRHLRSHSLGDVTYKCSDCDLVFQARDELIYHSAVHATQNLVCPLCKEQFDELDDVTEHIKLHATGEQYPCDYCDLIFPVLEKLEMHCLDEHREDHRGNEHVNLNDSNQNKSNSMEDDEEITDIVSHNGNVLEEIVAPKSKMYGYSRNSKKAPKILNKIENIEDLKDANVEVLAEFEIRRSARPNIQKNYARMIKTEISDVEDNQDEDKDDDFNIDTTDDPDDENYDPSVEDQVVDSIVAVPNEGKKTTTQEKITKFMQYSGKNSQLKPTTELPTGNDEKKKPAKSAEIQKVLNNLPRSVTVFKKENKESEIKSINSNDKEKSSKILNTKVIDNKTISVKTVPIPKNETKEVIKKNALQGKLTSTKPSQSKVSVPKIQTKPTVQIPQSRTQSTSSNNSSSPPRVNSQIVTKSSKTQPLATSTPQSSETTTKYCEMKIGDRMVKVQKVRMTKTQVDAMKKEGKIEMKDGAIILKNCSSSKISENRILSKDSKIAKKSPMAGTTMNSSPDKTQTKTK